MKNYYNSIKEQINYNKTIKTIIEEEINDINEYIPELTNNQKEQIKKTIEIGMALQRIHDINISIKWFTLATIVSAGISLSLIINLIISIVIS